MTNVSQRVVVIDDDADYCELVRIALARRAGGAEVQEFSSGLVALNALCAPGAEQPDALVVDLHMPVVGGVEVVSTLRQRNCTARIVIFSAALTSGDEERCLRAGADRVYAKPMSLKSLAATLEAALG